MIWNERLFEQLSNQDWAYCDETLDDATAAQWRKVMSSHQRMQHFRHAQIAHQTLNNAIRSDRIYWLDENQNADQKILSSLDEGRRLAQSTLNFPLPQLEAHFAIYSSGSYYKRHLDQPKGKSSRILTFTFYLHEHWQDHFGGELVITNGDTDETLAVIEPKPKRVVVFKSGLVWHEVRQSSFDRLSLTGWFRR